MVEYKTLKTKQADLEDTLNCWSNKGWTLRYILPKADMFLIIFDRQKSKHVEELNSAIDDLNHAVAASFHKK